MTTIEEMTPKALAATMDQTLLRSDAGPADYDALCDDGLRYPFATICVPLYWAGHCVKRLDGRRAVATIAGFPLGNTLTAIKAEEARRAADVGAAEVDMVINVGLLKAGLDDAAHEDVARVVEAAGPIGVKVIIECGLLTDEEKTRASRIVKAARARFVKSHTGLVAGGATVHDTEVLRAAVGPDFGVKASGGIRTHRQALDLLRAGATRLGTSAGVAIVEEAMRTAGDAPLRR